MPLQKSEKRSTAAKGAAPGTRVRAVPDFSKLHSKWTDRLEKGKACVKKPCTVAQEFNLSRVQTRSRHVSQECLNEGDSDEKDTVFESNKKSFDSIVNKKGLTSKYETGRMTMASTGVRPKTKSSVPTVKTKNSRSTVKKSASKRTAPMADENSPPGKEFETDASALQSIMDHTGVSDATFLPPTQPAPPTQPGQPDGVFCTPRQPPPRTTHALTEVRKSIYYTGPKTQNPKETSAIYTQYMKRMVSRLTVDGNAKAQSPLVKAQDDTAPLPSPLKLGVRAIPQRHSIYVKYEFPGQQKKDEKETAGVKDLSRSSQKPQRIARECNPLKSPARTPKTAQSCPRIRVNWKDVFGKSPKSVKKDPLATTLLFNELEEDASSAVSQLQAFEETENTLLSDIEKLKESRDRRHNQNIKDEDEADKKCCAKTEKEEIAEIEKLLEADIAAMQLDLEPDYNAMTHENTENRPPKDCPLPTWCPSMAMGKHVKYGDMYEDHLRLVPTAKPVSGKTVNRIPFGQLSSGEISKRSLFNSDSDSSGSSSDSSPSSQINRLSLNSAFPITENVESVRPVAKKIKRKASPTASLSSDEAPATPKQRRPVVVTSGGHRIFQDKGAMKSSSVKRLNSNGSNGNSPGRNSPLRTLSPNIKISQQRSPQSPSLYKLQKDSPLLLQSSEKRIRDLNLSPCVDQKVMSLLDQENVSPFRYRSPKRHYDADKNPTSYLSPKIARILQEENISPYTGLSPSISVYDKENASPNSPRLQKVCVSPKDKKDHLTYTEEDLNNTLSESMIQYEQLQSEAQLLSKPAEDEDANKIINQLEMIKKKQEKLLQIQDALQRQLLLQSAAKSKTKSKQSHSARKKIPFPKKKLKDSPPERKTKRVSFEDDNHLRQEVQTDSEQKPSEETLSPLPLTLADSSPEITNDSPFPRQEPHMHGVKEDLPMPSVCQKKESTVSPVECAKPEQVPVIPAEALRLQSVPVHQVDTPVTYSPCPKMAGLPQLMESPYLENTTNPIPIRTPLALRNEAERFSSVTGVIYSGTPNILQQTSQSNMHYKKNRLSATHDMPLDLSCAGRPSSVLSIDGVESSLEVSSLNMTGRDSLDCSKSNRSLDSSGISNGSPQNTLNSLNVSPPLATRIFPRRKMTPRSPGTNPSYLPAHLGMSTVPSRILSPRVMVASPGPLSLRGNISPRSLRLPQPRPMWPHCALTAGSALRYEEAMCDDEVARYACRLHSRIGTGPGELRCRPTNPVAKTLLTGDDTHMVPIETGMELRSQSTASPSLQALRCM